MDKAVFKYCLVARSGVLYVGVCSTFLACVEAAVECKRHWQRELPHSVFRLQLFYPNGKRVGKLDVQAALKAMPHLHVAA